MRIFDSYITFKIDNVTIRLEKVMLDKAFWTDVRDHVVNKKSNTFDIFDNDELLLSIHVLNGKITFQIDRVSCKIKSKDAAKLLEILDDIVNIPWVQEFNE